MSAALPSPIGLLLLPRFTVIALSSAIEPLRIANRYVPSKYSWQLLSIDGRPVVDANGISINVTSSLADAGELATLIVISDQDPEAHASPELLAHLRRCARRGILIGGVDTGCHVLALAGLLNGYRITAHWEVIPALSERFPGLEFTNSLFELDRDRLTCAGGTAVLDMILHAIEHDHGREVAVRVSEHCLHERIRLHSDNQRTELTTRYGVHHPKLLRAIDLMESNLELPLQFDEICKNGRISVRQTLRLFRKYLNVSPSRFYLHLRLERARQLLLGTDMSITEIAMACGFRSHSHFSRVFRNEYGHSPHADRQSPRRGAILKTDLPAKQMPLIG